MPDDGLKITRYERTYEQNDELGLNDMKTEGYEEHSIMLCLRSIRTVQRLGTRLYGQMFDPLDIVTGIEKRELLAHLAGDCDPFRIMPLKKGMGTRERPNLVPSAFCSRIVACYCSPDDLHLQYMWLHMGYPKRCSCGHWFELCPVAPL